MPVVWASANGRSDWLIWRRGIARTGRCRCRRWWPWAACRIDAVKRQFEALRPARILTAGHRDGDELDTDRAIRARVDLLATGEGDDRV